VSSSHSAEDLQRIYSARFTRDLEYRDRVWRALIDERFSRYVGPSDTVLDLGCGYGQFINNVRCGVRMAMDLNPDAPRHLDRSVTFLRQDCSTTWQVADGALDVVFTSNFFEHLPDKAALGRTLDEVLRCLRPGGRLVALGPNIRYLPGRYWDFWDHHLPLSDASLCEALTTRGFRVAERHGRFLPYTMADGRRYPTALIRAYLRLRPAWRLLGRQFLVVAERPA
jgi:SAM-dependent methyltransferase